MRTLRTVANAAAGADMYTRRAYEIAAENKRGFSRRGGSGGFGRGGSREAYGKREDGEKDGCSAHCYKSRLKISR